MDFNALAENLGLEKDEYIELVELFIETGKPQLIELNGAVEKKNGDHIRKIAHSLKGASGNLGLMEIYEESKKMEEQSSSQNYRELAESIEKIECFMKTLSKNVAES